MEDLARISIEDLNHAYVVPSLDTETKKSLYTFLTSTLKIPVQGNPDVIELHLDTLGVDDARFLIDQAIHVPIGKAKFFIVSFSFAGTEAQNALLKMLEEPTSRTHFFILVPSLGTLLETVRSRLQVLSVRHESSSKLGEQFLSSTPKDRLQLVKSAIEDKDKSWALSLVSALERVIHERLQKNPKSEDLLQGGKVLLSVRRHLEARSASVKMILEYLTAALPG